MNQQLRLRCILLVTSLIFIMLLSIDEKNMLKILSDVYFISSDLSGEIKRDREGSIVPKVPSCVPNYSFLMQIMQSKIGRREEQQVPMKLIAAYDYYSYSVVTTEVVGWYGKPVYCRYLDNNNLELGHGLASTVFPESVVYCCNREGAVRMTISEEAEEPISEAVHITDRRRSDPKYLLSLCLAPIYGREIKWLMLAELFEHYKLQGVEHFYIYVKEIDNYSKKLIDYYETIGEAEVVSLEAKEIKNVISVQLVATAECLQRSRHHSRYAFFPDLDERVLPVHGFTLSSFVKKTMAEVPNRAMMRLTSRWVFRTSSLPKTYKGEETLKNHLPMMVFLNSSAVPPRRIVRKCILDPKHVLIHYVHRPRAYYPGYGYYEVPFDEVHIRHYRALSDSRGLLSRIVRYGPFQLTKYPDGHINELYRNVKEILDKIYNI